MEHTWTLRASSTQIAIYSSITTLLLLGEITLMGPHHQECIWKSVFYTVMTTVLHWFSHSLQLTYQDTGEEKAKSARIFNYGLGNLWNKFIFPDHLIYSQTMVTKKSKTHGYANFLCGDKKIEYAERWNYKKLQVYFHCFAYRYQNLFWGLFSNELSIKSKNGSVHSIQLPWKKLIQYDWRIYNKTLSKSKDFLGEPMRIKF